MFCFFSLPELIPYLTWCSHSPRRKTQLLLQRKMVILKHFYKVTFHDCSKVDKVVHSYSGAAHCVSVESGCFPRFEFEIFFFFGKLTVLNSETFIKDSGVICTFIFLYKENMYNRTWAACLMASCLLLRLLNRWTSVWMQTQTSGPEPVTEKYNNIRYIIKAPPPFNLKKFI